MAIETRIQSGKIVFGNWEVQQLIGNGSGGKTAVYTIRRNHDGWQETAALKVVNILEKMGQKELLAASYQQEYEAECGELCKQAEKELHLMNKLRGNSYIVEYYDFAFVDYQEENTFGTDLLIRMELLQSLRQEREEKREYTEAEVIHIGENICKGLQACHQQGILHRDIKPANIFVTAWGDYKLGNFGIARMVDAGQSTGTQMGTSAYAAPEQFLADEKKYDNRVDIYSLGLTLYELSPEHASTELSKAIQKACAFQAEDRFLTAADFCRALSAAAASAGTEKEKPHPLSKEKKKRKKEWLAPTVFVGLLLLAVFLTVICILEFRTKEETTELPVPETTEEENVSEENVSEENQDPVYVPVKLEKLTSEEYTAILGKSAYVTATENNVAVITDTGDLYVWGSNEYGQVGCGGTEMQNKPIRVLKNVASVQMNELNTAALTQEGELYIWGNNDFFQIGNGDWEDQHTPLLVMNDVKEMSLGIGCCGALLENGDLYGWGDPNGNGIGMDRLHPTLVAGNVETFAMGRYNGGAVTTEGDLYMWGENWNGQVGNGSKEPNLTPVKIMENVKTLCLGTTTSSVITKDGELYVWGANEHGQVGNGELKDRAVEEPIRILPGISQVFWSTGASSAHGAAITVSGALYMWGNNDNGQLLENSYSIYDTPEKIIGSKVAYVSLGQRHTAVIMENGDLYLFGDNSSHQINDSKLWKIMEMYKAAENIISVAVNRDTTYAVGADGTFYCWGD